MGRGEGGRENTGNRALSLWGERHALHEFGTGNTAMLLFDWNINVTSKRYCVHNLGHSNWIKRNSSLHSTLPLKYVVSIQTC